MLALDELSLSDLTDPRMRLIVDMLTRSVFTTAVITGSLEAAGLNPGDYPLETAKLAWMAAVPDAARRGKLDSLIARVTDNNRAFASELQRRMQPLLATASGEHPWYYHDDPYTCTFVGPRASRAVIDRAGLRQGLHALATDQYRILVVSGAARSGKSHSWVLVDHLRSAGKLLGMNRFVRVTTHTWSGEVSGEDLALSLADKLGLDIKLTPSRELDDARIRKILDMVIGRYPQGDGITRWIILDGLDRPGVQNSARDMAKRLISLVDEGELPQTRLVVTGLDLLGLTVGYTVQLEEIPSIRRDLVRSFLADAAAHLGHPVTDVELDACVTEVLGPAGAPHDLRDVEEAVVRLVKSRWAAGA